MFSLPSGIFSFFFASPCSESLWELCVIKWNSRGSFWQTGLFLFVCFFCGGVIDVDGNQDAVVRRDLTDVVFSRQNTGRVENGAAFSRENQEVTEVFHRVETIIKTLPKLDGKTEPVSFYVRASRFTSCFCTSCLCCCAQWNPPPPPD